MLDKNTSYFMDIYSLSAKTGQMYPNSSLLFYQINLNNYSSNDKVLTHYYISDPETGEIYIKNFVFYTFEKVHVI